jgi:putative glutamine amidotransferase
MKKRIGISYTSTNFQNYWNWFTADDLKEVELVNLSFEENNESDISTCDGFILTGGIDVDPAYYESNDEYDNRPHTFQRERDQFEEKIYRYSQEKKLPVLGICRGLQLINVLEGGKLIQDLGDDNEIHKKAGDKDKQHLVQILDGSLLGEITHLNEGQVNSAHHQIIDPDAIGNNLQVNAWSGEAPATAEGLEWIDKQGKGFLLCVQWHPERMNSKEQNPLSQKIKEKFLSEITKDK